MEVSAFAALAIIGADIRIDCILNQALSRLKTLADDLRVDCMFLYSKHVNCDDILNDKNESSSNLNDTLDQQNNS